MKKNFIVVLIILISLFIFSETINYPISFDKNNLEFVKYNNYDIVKLKNAGQINETGNPKLPVKAFSFSIPYNAKIKNIYLTNIVHSNIEGNFNIYPAQEPLPISYKINTSFKKNYELYESNTLYPVNNIYSYNTGKIGGNKIINILINPLQYNPSTGVLILLSNCNINIEYEYENSFENIPYLPNNIAFDKLSKLVLNKESILRNQPVRMNPKSILLDADTIEYVIITSSEFDTIFERLAEWKTKKGVPACVVTTDWIYANYTGVDYAEQVRNFIIDANSTWGTIYVLLGGQCDYENGQEIVPRRDVYYYTSGAGYYSDEDTIPSDVYYSDLDGDWNADGDAIWGERYDNVDLYSDIFVGRAPVRTIEQAQGFVNKIFTYEKTPYYGYEKKLMLSSGILWDTYEGDTIFQNTIANMAPLDWTVTKLYEKYGNLSHTAFIDSIELGYNLGHLVGHGNEYGIYTSTSSYWNYIDADSMTNMPKIGIFNSIACFVAALDEVTNGDSYGEKLVMNPDGGAYATIMNTRYGWGYPPSIGPSEIIDTNFYHDIYINNEFILGEVHAYSKDAYVPYASWNSVEVWCIYELTLFGDPESDIWTDNPDTLLITHEDSIPLGSYTMNINVSSKTTSSPVENAKICIMDSSMAIYEIAYTDASGNASILISSTFPENIDITVTAHNFIPAESNTEIYVTDRFVGYLSYNIDDSLSGNNNGIWDAGETTDLNLTVKNFGINTADSVYGIITCSDTFVTIITDSTFFGNIAADSTATGNYSISIDSNIPDNYTIEFTLICTDINDSNWTTYFNVEARHFSNVYGYVRSFTDNNDLQNSIVYCFVNDTFYDTTDINGYYLFENLPGGDYTIVATNDVYLPETLNFIVPEDTSLDFSLKRPLIDIDCDSFYFEMEINTINHDTLTLYNFGDTDLTYSTEIVATSTASKAPTVIVSVDPNNGTIPISGQSLMDITIATLGTATGEFLYDLIIHSNDPQIPDTTVDLVIFIPDDTTGILNNNQIINEIIDISPISYNKSINIYSSSLNSNNLNIDIYDISGRKIQSLNLNYKNHILNNTIKFNTSGIYFIKAYNNSLSEIKKIIIMN